MIIEPKKATSKERFGKAFWIVLKMRNRIANNTKSSAEKRKSRRI